MTCSNIATAPILKKPPAKYQLKVVMHEPIKTVNSEIPVRIEASFTLPINAEMPAMRAKKGTNTYTKSDNTNVNCSGPSNMYDKPRYRTKFNKLGTTFAKCGQNKGTHSNSRTPAISS